MLINKSSGKFSDLKQSIKKKFNNFFIVTPKQKSSDLCHLIISVLYFMKLPGTVKKNKIQKFFYNHTKAEICKKKINIFTMK